MKMLKWLCFCCVLFILSTANAQSIHTPLRDGDQAYDKEQYKTAEKNYRIAADRDMGNPQVVYNLGNALFQQGNFEDAESRYLQAAEKAQKPELQADAMHNLGDAYLKQRKYKEAAKAYEQSLRLRPADPSTKQNLQIAKKKLREEEQKQQQQQQQQQQQDSNQDSNQPAPQNPENQSDKPQDQPNQAPQKNPPGQAPPEQQKKQEEQQLKKEEAKRLLETAVGPEDRKNAQKYRAAQQQSKPKGSKKDW